LTLNPKPEFLPENFYDKIIRDRIDIGTKNSFLTACNRCDCETEADKTSGLGTQSIEAVYQVFSVPFQSSGDPITLKSGEILGRVTNLQRAVSYIAKGLRQSTDDVLQMFLWLSDPAPTPSQLGVAEEWLEILKAAIDPSTRAPFAISPLVCWVFRSNEGKDDANDDMNSEINCLPCRLGLPDFLNDDEVYLIGLDYLCLTVRAEDITNARSSNFCHGEYISVRDIWEPGGMTAPIPYGPKVCVDKKGLPEVICDPVSYQQVPGPIRIVRT